MPTLHRLPGLAVAGKCDAWRGGLTSYVLHPRLLLLCVRSPPTCKPQSLWGEAICDRWLQAVPTCRPWSSAGDRILTTGKNVPSWSSQYCSTGVVPSTGQGSQAFRAAWAWGKCTSPLGAGVYREK